jgi:hypothetical protein
VFCRIVSKDSTSRRDNCDITIPSMIPELFLEFARLNDGRSLLPSTILIWVQRYGLLASITTLVLRSGTSTQIRGSHQSREAKLARACLKLRSGAQRQVATRRSG